MNLFHIVDDAAAILRQRGRYTQNKVYRRGEEIYAQAGKDSFVKLIKGNGTSDPSISWIDVAGPGITAFDRNPKWIDPEIAAVQTSKPAPKTRMSVVKG